MDVKLFVILLLVVAWFLAGLLWGWNVRRKSKFVTERQSKLFTERLKSFYNPYEHGEYILIPGGQYEHSVTEEIESVPDMYFAKYPVTNRQYRRFIRYLEGKERKLLIILPSFEFDMRLYEFASGITDRGEYRYFGGGLDCWPSRVFVSSFDTLKPFSGEDQPVVGISWFMARAYCYWLSLLEAGGENLSYDKASRLYRLPSEIEWEWAAGGGEREYPWVSDKGPPSDKLANYVYGVTYADNNVGATTLVGRYPEGATPDGLMDMAGNVREWMENWYDEDKHCRSLRGGSWSIRGLDLRCSDRYGEDPDDHFNDVGFRVVRSQS